MIGLKGPSEWWKTIDALRYYERDMTNTQTNTVDQIFDAIETQMILGMKTKANILFESLRLNEIFKKNVVIAGGCFTSWYHGEHPKDYDIFVIGDIEEQTKVKNILESMLVGLVDTTETYRRDNDKIIGVWQDKNHNQIIYTHYKTRQELIEHFDFTHCMISYYEDKIHLTRKTFDAIANKHLIPNQKDRIAQWRIEKFKSRGFTFPVNPTTIPTPHYNQQRIYPTYQKSLNPFKNGMARVNPMRSMPLPDDLDDVSPF